MNNKKILYIIILILSLIILSGCNRKKDSLNIYNYGDYMDRQIIKEFEKEFNIKINYNNYANNEDMYIAIKQGGTSYDIAFPSDYMIERMIKEDLLEEIDKNIVKNIEYIDKDLLDKEFDRDNKYSIPYFYGTLGIAYDKRYIDKKDLESWSILWDKKYENEILMLDSLRDSFAISLKRLGYSMNTTHIEELNQAKDELIKQKEIVYAYVGDEIKDLMVAEEGKLAVVWSGDAYAMCSENPNLDYAIPKEGTNLWFDSMVILKGTKNKDMANEFINFLNRPDIAARNSEYVEYATANLEGQKYLDDKIKDSHILFPDLKDLENTEVFKDPKDILKLYNDLWIEIKASRR